MTSTGCFQPQQVCESVKRCKELGKEPASFYITLELQIYNDVAWQSDSVKSLSAVAVIHSPNTSSAYETNPDINKSEAEAFGRSKIYWHKQHPSSLLP